VITDIQMPVMNGFEVPKQIRELDTDAEVVRHRVTVLALTAHVTNKVEKSAIKVGMKQVLAKPLEYPDLKTVIKQFYFHLKTMSIKVISK